MAEKILQQIDIFISSPDDVEEEKKIALKVIEEKNSNIFISDKYILKSLEHKIIVPAVIGNAPQKTCELYMKKTDQADILICILWSRMGTPLIDEETGKEFQSGTEYELITAYEANKKTGKPVILLYHCMKDIPVDRNFIQANLVQEFFKSFEGKEANFKGIYREYRSNEDFKDILGQDLDKKIRTNFQQYSAEKIIDHVHDPSAVPDYPNQLRELATRNHADEITKTHTHLHELKKVLSIHGQLCYIISSSHMIKNLPHDPETNLISHKDAYAFVYLFELLYRLKIDAELLPFSKISENWKAGDFISVGGPLANDITEKYLRLKCPGFQVIYENETVKTESHKSTESNSVAAGFCCGKYKLMANDEEEYGFLVKLTESELEQERTIHLIFGYSGIGTGAAAYFLWKNFLKLSNKFNHNRYFVGIKVHRNEGHKSISSEFIDLTPDAFNKSEL